MESFAVRFDKCVNIYMRKTSNDTYSEKDNTVKLLSPFIKNDKTVILAAYKEFFIVLRNKSDYIRKFNNIIEE